MSTAPESEFDLEKLFLPAWAQEAPKANRYADFAGEDRVDRRFDEGKGARRRPRPDMPRGPRPAGDRFGADKGRRPGQRPQGEEGPRREPLPPPTEISVSILPDEKGVESLARQIRMTGRAYPLFEIAHLILQKPERQQFRFDVKKNAEGQPIQPLFLCALDETLWLSQDEAVQHILSRHFDTLYQAERTATNPPRGTYTFVAQCGMSGAILGPPNYHDYQNQLRKLHAERFARMPFEAFKARVKIVKDEAVVKKWIEERSFKTEYNCLNVPEPRKLGSREEVEKHFREVHAPTLIKQVETYTAGGAAARQLRSPGLQRAWRAALDEQRRFPLRVATVLSQQFAGHGLQFFKVNRTVTHVSVARPRYLDLEATPVSEGVKRIVDYINANPKCTRRKLLESLAPTPPPAAAAPAPAPAEGTAPPPVAGTAAPPVAEATPEQTAVASDLHWLIHEGHVIEFGNAVLETAKKPLPRPPPPVKKPAPAAQSPVAGQQPAQETESGKQKAEPPVSSEAPVEVAVQEAEIGNQKAESGQQVTEPPVSREVPDIAPPAASEPAAEAAPAADAPSPSASAG